MVIRDGDFTLTDLTYGTATPSEERDRRVRKEPGALQTEFGCSAKRLAPVRGVELGEDVLRVRPQRVQRDVQFAGDGGTTEIAAQQTQYVELTGAERINEHRGRRWAGWRLQLRVADGSEDPPCVSARRSTGRDGPEECRNRGTGVQEQSNVSFGFGALERVRQR